MVKYGHVSGGLLAKSLRWEVPVRQCYQSFKGCNPKAVQIESPGDWFMNRKLTHLSDPWIAQC